MYNDFVLIGPKDDPAGTKGKDITAALQKLAAANGQSCFTILLTSLRSIRFP